MPQSLTCLLYHIIFSTKHRDPFIADELKPHLHAYLGGILHEIEGRPIAVGGVEDHVHILAYLAKTMTIPDVLCTLKANSSGWVHRMFPTRATFAWQAGYGIFTVSVSSLEEVRRYISNQVEHHRHTTFQDEYRAFLRRHEVELDERYVWD